MKLVSNQAEFCWLKKLILMHNRQCTADCTVVYRLVERYFRKIVPFKCYKKKTDTFLDRFVLILNSSILQKYFQNLLLYYGIFCVVFFLHVPSLPYIHVFNYKGIPSMLVTTEVSEIIVLSAITVIYFVASLFKKNFF